MEPKATVTTCIGDIVVYENADPQHPGLTIMLRPKDIDYEIDLVYLESKEDRDNDYNPDNLYVYCYEDVYTEDWTHEFTINGKDVAEALNSEN